MAFYLSFACFFVVDGRFLSARKSLSIFFSCVDTVQSFDMRLGMQRMQFTELEIRIVAVAFPPSRFFTQPFARTINSLVVHWNSSLSQIAAFALIQTIAHHFLCVFCFVLFLCFPSLDRLSLRLFVRSLFCFASTRKLLRCVFVRSIITALPDFQTNNYMRNHTVNRIAMQIFQFKLQLLRSDDELNRTDQWFSFSFSLFLLQFQWVLCIVWHFGPAREQIYHDDLFNDTLILFSDWRFILSHSFWALFIIIYNRKADRLCENFRISLKRPFELFNVATFSPRFCSTIRFLLIEHFLLLFVLFDGISREPQREPQNYFSQVNKNCSLKSRCSEIANYLPINWKKIGILP